MFKKTVNPITIVAFLFIGIANQLCYGHSHTHIGCNQDQIWGNADDNKLWFFSMPGTPDWPNWGRNLELVPQGTFHPTTGKELYKCDELYCWHSAHPQHGNWQLGGTDPSIEPEWAISLQRVSFDTDFFILDDYEQLVLASDGDEYAFDHLWMDDKYNETGTLGARGIHAHLWFYVWADGPGEIFNTTFKAIDYGTTGFATSDVYTMTFETVPEPATMFLLVFGAAVLRRRCRGQMYPQKLSKRT